MDKKSCKFPAWDLRENCIFVAQHWPDCVSRMETVLQQFWKATKARLLTGVSAAPSTCGHSICTSRKMAVAAFRSTTKRNCSIGGNDNNSSNSRAKHTTPQKRGHRRSKSLSDTSPRYASDTGSGGDGRFGPADTGFHVRQSWSVQPSSDSESEAEGFAQRRRYQRTSLDFGSLRRDLARGEKCRQCTGLRRSSSQLDLSNSQADVVCRHGRIVAVAQQSKDCSEAQVEEKTIRTIHSQMKPLESDPPSVEQDPISLYNAMRAEVRRAVADLRVELEQSMGKEPTSPSATSSGESCPTSQATVQTEVFQAVAEVRREFAAKLEQSEKRAQELWTQLAVEERRCLDLVKFVKEILPTCGLQPRQSLPQVVRGPLEKQMLRMGGDKQWVSKTLDEDARRYFEECVSISALDAEGKDVSSPVKQDLRVRSPGRVIRSTPGSPLGGKLPAESSRKSNDKGTEPVSLVRSPSDLSLSDTQDGLVLPWLDWETEVENGPKKGSRNDNIHQEPSRAACSYNWDNCQVDTTSESAFPEFREFGAGVEAGFSALSLGDKSSRGVAGDAGRFLHSNLPKALDGSFQRRWHRWKHGIKSEEYVVQRIRFRNRISSGRIHICGGKRL